MLDDAAFFAANSHESDVLFLTTAFTTYLSRPVSSGRLKAIGKVVKKNKSQCNSESVLYDSSGNEVGRGNGIFMRTKTRFSDAMGYGA